VDFSPAPWLIQYQLFYQHCKQIIGDLKKAEIDLGRDGMLPNGRLCPTRAEGQM
jgi:hypothetical protein